jgi:hypothetical protein
MLFGNSGKVYRGAKQIAQVITWSIDHSGASPTDWSGGLTATFGGRPELGDASLELQDNGGRTWVGQATITDVPFRVPRGQAVEIGFQGAGALERSSSPRL